MILFKDSRSLTRYLESHAKPTTIIGFVPTMGALHAGHISLLAQSKKEAGITICSIFVNPTQFNDKKDFEKYPVTIEEDINKIESAGTEILFLPGTSDLYPSGTDDLEQYDIGYLETILEGQFRPGHFQGVSQVMQRLLKVIRPDKLFMGQKDYQQSLVVQRLLRSVGEKTQLIVCPTLREYNGLAMSSRNMRLSDSEKATAGSIYQTLQYIQKNLQPGSLKILKSEAVSLLEKKGFKVDYVEIADTEDLAIQDNWDGKQKLVAVIAAFMNEVRLIDNMTIS